MVDFFIGAAVCVVLVSWLASWLDKGLEVFVVLAALWVIGLVYQLNTNAEWAQQRAESTARAAAQDAADRQPHIVREVDGCKVYAFKSGDRYHFFTRCPGQCTTTESTHLERRGKSQIETSTSIVTQ